MSKLIPTSLNYRKPVITAILVCITMFMVSSCSKSGGSSSGGGGVVVTRLLVLGDSHGNGFGIATPYSIRIANTLGVPLANNSVNSRQTSGGLAIVNGLLAAEQPSHMIVLLGTNDAIQGIVSGAVVNLQAIINAGVAAGVIVIVGTLPPFTNSSANNFRAAQISEGIRGLSGASIAEVRGVLGDGSATIADGIHPNDFGQQLIADEFLRFLQ